MLEALQREPPFVHVDQQAATSESRWAPLYKTEPAITRARRGRSAAHIAHVLDTAAETARPRASSSRRSSCSTDAPTARLERAFAEHVDCCTYRFDAWQLGLVNLQLDAMRGTAGEGEQDGEQAARTGVYLGAYGWLEDVRPQARELTPVELPGDLAEVFGGDGQPPLVRDPANGGYVHAPSLNQAVTAAVLRNGYLANASPRRARRARGQPLLRAGAPRARRARGHPQRPEPRRRCSATASSAGCTTATRWPRSTSSSSPCARRSRCAPTA